MKNITLKVDDETYQKARVRAARKGTSVSAMVRDFLVRDVAGDDTEALRVGALKKLYAEADAHATSRAEPLVPLTREEMYAERLH